jgi:hypothetical protein
MVGNGDRFFGFILPVLASKRVNISEGSAACCVLGAVATHLGGSFVVAAMSVVLQMEVWKAGLR